DFAGNWKVLISANPVQTVTIGLIRLEKNEDQWQLKILSGLPGMKVNYVRVEGRGIHFIVQTSGVKISFDAYAPKEESKPAKLLGSVRANGQRNVAVLERTDLQTLAADVIGKPVDEPDKAELEKPLEATDDKLRQEALEALWKKHRGGAFGQFVGQQLLGVIAKKGGSEAEARPVVEEMGRQAALYGPEM